jgi:hypothetical protein
VVEWKRGQKSTCTERLWEEGQLIGQLTSFMPLYNHTWTLQFQSYETLLFSALRGGLRTRRKKKFGKIPRAWSQSGSKRQQLSSRQQAHEQLGGSWANSWRSPGLAAASSKLLVLTTTGPHSTTCNLVMKICTYIQSTTKTASPVRGGGSSRPRAL